jgi:hypothetical protein
MLVLSIYKTFFYQETYDFLEPVSFGKESKQHKEDPGISITKTGGRRQRTPQTGGSYTTQR